MFTESDIKEQLKTIASLNHKEWNYVTSKNAAKWQQDVKSNGKAMLLLVDPFYDAPECYTADYILNLLTAAAPLCDPCAVAIVMGNYKEISALIAHFSSSKTKNRSVLRKAGWGWADISSFDIVNSTVRSNRSKGMVSNRECSLVVYGTGWNKKANKLRYMNNALHPQFWTNIPRRYRPAPEHQANTLTNTLTGYVPHRSYLKHPDLKTRVRPRSEKNPMLYFYWMQR